MSLTRQFAPHDSLTQATGYGPTRNGYPGIMFFQFLVLQRRTFAYTFCLGALLRGSPPIQHAVPSMLIHSRSFWVWQFL
jgi:hypothetical protein